MACHEMTSPIVSFTMGKLLYGGSSNEARYVKGSSVDVCQAAELRHGNFGIGLDPQKPHQSLPNDTARILRPAIFGIDFFSLQNMTPSSTDSGNCFVSAQLPESDYC